MADNGFGWGTALAIGGGCTILGTLFGMGRGKRTSNERWLTAVQKCAEQGLPSGSDLNEDERKGLMKTLLNHADAGGVVGSVTDKIQSAAKDLLAGAGIEAWIKGKESADSVSEELLIRVTHPEVKASASASASTSKSKSKSKKTEEVPV